MIVAALEILTTGPLALIEDLGRPGLEHLGVTRSGAADRRAHGLANRLLANPLDHATVEVTFGGFSARVHGGGSDGIAMAVTGADAEPAVDGIRFGANSVRRVLDGQVISLQAPRTGLRSYLGVRGGITVDAVLGSRSHDVLSAIGPRPLRSGDVFPIGSPSGALPGLEQAPVQAITAGPVNLAVVPGPRDDWFTEPDRLVHDEWTATDHGDRVGLRLSGEPLHLRQPDRELPSEGMVVGSIQVPPNGFPVILGPDHPVTGGYPVIGVVADDDVDDVAQIRPGQLVRFHWSRSRERR